MSIVPPNHEDTAATNPSGLVVPSGLMALVHGWLSDLPRQPDTPCLRRAALRRELDAFAWRLVGRLDGVDACEDDTRTRDSAGQG